MAPRSRTGCLTCRHRKLKCSEERPTCAQCVKANRECIPSSGITFRHQQNPSMNADPAARESLKNFYGYRECFTNKTIWVSVPKELTFIHTTNPYEDEDGVTQDDPDETTLLHHEPFGDSRAQAEISLSQALYPGYATRGLEALSAVAAQDQYGFTSAPALPHHDLATETQQEPAQDLDFLLGSAGTALASLTNLDPRLHTPPTTASTTTSIQQQTLTSPNHIRTLSYSSVSARPVNLLAQKALRPPPIHDRELAFFLRDFSERTGHWMDIFDLDCFFGAHVPVLAVKCPLLVYACAALSAKSLARVNGRKPVMNGQTSKSGRSKLEHWPGLAMTTDDWIRKGRENYDVAVSLLRQSIMGASRPRTSSLPIEITASAHSTALPSTDSDELVAATAILCVYEFLDASSMEWSRHLDGAKSLFDAAKEGLPLVHAPSPMTIAVQASQHLVDSVGSDVLASKRPSAGRVAVFWNFARQDMLAAFINNTTTRLDTNDLPMWQGAGLRLTFDGRVQPSNPQHSEYDRDNAMQDDMICNALIWLMSKLVNYIASSEVALDAVSPLSLDMRHQALIDEWNDLNDQFRIWHDGLPDSFRPSVLREADDGFGMAETWFPRSMCSSTMQSYHFARIQLLHHKPPSIIAGQRRAGFAGASLATRHAEYSTILQQTRAHAKEIVSIALGRADEGARVHSVQPLWTAGLVLGGGVNDDGQASPEAEMWRCTIVSLLRAIERDMGWAAEYRVRNLLDLWNLPHDWDPESNFALG